MTQVGLFSLLFTPTLPPMTPDRNLSVSVPVAPETLAAHRTREKEFEKFRSFAHCKWICVERDGQYLTPPKRPTTSTDQTPPDADMPNPSKELPRAELRLASPVAIRSPILYIYKAHRLSRITVVNKGNGIGMAWAPSSVRVLVQEGRPWLRRGRSRGGMRAVGFAKSGL